MITIPRVPRFKSVPEVIEALQKRREILFYQLKHVDNLILAAQRLPRPRGGNHDDDQSS